MENYVVYWVHLPNHTDYNTQGYVGITNNFIRRMYEHKSKATGIFKNAINKYGWANLDKTILVKGIDLELACLVEEELRSSVCIGWNLTIGGEGGFLQGDLNPMKTPEQRERASRAQRGELNHNWGKKLDPAGRERLSGVNASTFKSAILATCISTGETTRIVGKKALTAFGFLAYCVYNCLSENQRQTAHRGYTFKRETI